MIVNICGGLLMINAFLGVIDNAIAPFFSDGVGWFAPRINIGLLALSIAYGVAGYGLLIRNRIARWWLLGPFLVSPLVMLLAIGLGVIAYGMSAGSEEAAASLDNSIVGRFVDEAVWQLWLGAIMAFVSAALDFRCYFYLRSAEGRDEFGVSNNETIIDVLKSLAANIAIFVVVVKVDIDVAVPRSGPSRAEVQAGQERETRSKEDLRRERRARYQSSGIAAFSSSGSHLLMQTPSVKSGWMLIDLRTGDATWPPIRDVTVQDASELEHALSPDGGYLFGRFGLVDLASGKTRPFTELVPEAAVPLGFSAARNFLVFDPGANAFTLVNLDTGTQNFAVPAWVSEPRTFESLSHTWSPQHDFFAWFDGVATVSTLNLETGEVLRMSCEACVDRVVRYSNDGATLLFIDDPRDANVLRGTLVLDSNGDAKPVPLLEGAPDYFATFDGVPAAVWHDRANEQLIWQSMDSVNSWRLSLRRASVLGFPAGDRLITLTEARRGGAGYGYARFIAPIHDNSVPYEGIPLSNAGAEFRAMSPDGAYMLLEGPAGEIEILAFAKGSGGTRHRGMNVVEDKKLVKKAPDGYPEFRLGLVWNEYWPDGSLRAGHTSPPDNVEAAPATAPATEQAAEPPSSRKMVKCRDASGSMTYTQGHCPAGTTLVESPSF